MVTISHCQNNFQNMARFAQFQQSDRKSTQHAGSANMPILIQPCFHKPNESIYPIPQLKFRGRRIFATALALQALIVLTQVPYS